MPGATNAADRIEGLVHDGAGTTGQPLARP
jgi:hypothetical protein